MMISMSSAPLAPPRAGRGRAAPACRHRMASREAGRRIRYGEAGSRGVSSPLGCLTSVSLAAYSRPGFSSGSYSAAAAQNRTGANARGHGSTFDKERRRDKISWLG